ncbi:MAG: methyl-accepting chemotaxis protein [Burkholderiales bacterium]|nr:methyl-accepting chemotaxis protein [Burkholderiales bacterium]
MTEQTASLDHFRLRADRIMEAALAALLAVSLGLAILTGQWLPALLVGLPAAAVPLLLLRIAPGALAGRAAVAVAFIVFPALMIQMTRGMLEMHFGIFVMLAALLVYCDWRLIVLAAGVVAVHHLGFNALQAADTGAFVLPQAASFGIIGVHAAFVVFETVVLVYLSLMLRDVIRASAATAALAARIGDGDLSAGTEALAGDDGLARSVAAMQRHLRETVGAIRSNTDAVHGAVTGLADSSSALAAGAAAQSQSTAAIAAAVQELTVSVNQLSGNARDARSLVGQAARTAAAGGEVVRKSVDDMRGIESAIADAREEIERLGERSEAASRVVQIINEIATQTNLLALNAAIEAARAGEAGRGFAVVSDEVRKLAERTQKSTSEIQDMMSGMLDSKSALAARMDAAVSRVASGVANVTEAGESIEHIVADAERVGTVVTEISAALEEQSQAAADIARNVESITGMSDSSVAVSTAVSRDIENLRGVASALTGIVARFRT